MQLLSQFICPAPITSMVCVPGASALGGTLNIYIGDKLGKIHQLDYHPASESVRNDLLCDTNGEEFDMD